MLLNCLHKGKFKLTEGANLCFQDGIMILDDKLTIKSVNSCATKIVDVLKQELIGYPLRHLFANNETLYSEMYENLKTCGDWCGEIEIIAQSNEPHSIWLSISPLDVSESDKNGCYIVLLQNITNQKHIKNIIMEILENMVEGVLITNAAEEILYVNAAFETITGYSLHEVIGQNPKVLKSGVHDDDYYDNMWMNIHQKGNWEGEIWNKRKDQLVYPERLQIHAIKDSCSNVTNYLAIFSNITDQKQAQEQLHHLSFYDQLTGIANRDSITKRLPWLLKTAETRQQKLAVLFLGLDRFKLINDTLGFRYGDILLKLVSNRIREVLQEKHIISRFGGDEFVIVLPSIKHRKEAIAVAKRINDCLKESFKLGLEEVFITTSIGISLFPEDGIDAETILRNADKAMYQAKLSGRNTFKMYKRTMHNNEERLLQLENLLRKAIEREEFYLEFHPVVDVRTKMVSSVEALIRWQDSELGIISPNEFITLAEDTGLIIPISEWVLRSSCKALNVLHYNGFTNIKVNINISPLHFKQANFVETIEQVITEANLRRNCIILELTENMIMSHEADMVNKLVKLKQLGLNIAIDDFGTGYSSLSYLHRFPIDYLKIDQSFIKNIVDYKEDAAIAKAIITIARALNLRVVAEGVEHKKQYQFLEQEGCTNIQGFFISKPLKLSPLLQFLKDWDTDLL